MYILYNLFLSRAEVGGLIDFSLSINLENNYVRYAAFLDFVIVRQINQRFLNTPVNDISFIVLQIRGEMFCFCIKIIHKLKC